MAELIREFVAYEPKMKNRWLIKMTPVITSGYRSTKLEEWVYVSTNRPIYKRKRFWFFWSRLEIEPIWVEMTDPISPSSTTVIYKLIKDDSKIDYELEILDPTGVAIEKWELKGCEILEIDFGRLNYSDNDTMICKLLIKPKKVKLLF